MEVQVENLSAVEKKLTIRVPAERVSKELDDAYRNLQRDVVLPGFRRGKVPRKFLEHRFGHHVNGEVGSKIITETFEKAAEQEKVVPVSQPLIEKGEIRAGQDYEFTVRVEVRPEFKVEGYSGLEVPFERVEVTDAEVDAEIERGRRQAGSIVVIDEDRPLGAGDLAEVDFALSAEGQADFSQERHTLGEADPQLGVLFPMVLGLTVGGEASGPVTLKKDFYQRRFAGKEVQARVVLRAIKSQVIPEIGDELAQDLGHGSLDAWKAEIRFRIQEVKEKGARDKASNKAVEMLLAAHPVEVPPGLLRNQAEQMIRNTTAHLQSRGMKVRALHLDDLDADNRANVMEEAAFAIRRSLVLESVSDQEGIAVADEDLDARIRQIAESNGQRVEAVRGILMKNQGIDDLKARIREEKALDFLLERATIVEVDPEPPAPAAPGPGAEGDEAAPDPAGSPAAE